MKTLGQKYDEFFKKVFPDVDQYSIQYVTMKDTWMAASFEMLVFMKNTLGSGNIQEDEKLKMIRSMEDEAGMHILNVVVTRSKPQ